MQNDNMNPQQMQDTQNQQDTAVTDELIAFLQDLDDRVTALENKEVDEKA